MASPSDKLSVIKYFELPETTRPMELVYGVVREPPMPAFGHQLISARLTALLYAHVEEFGLGQLSSPVDVVLDPIRSDVLPRWTVSVDRIFA